MNRAIDIALQDYGLKEVPGANHEQKIIQMFKDAGHSWVQDDETAWCSAFVNSVHHKACLPLSRKLNAISWLEIGEPVTDPVVGDVVVFWRKFKGSGYGHVGFYINETDTHIRVLGGNQSNEVNIALYPKDRLEGYRRFKQIEE
ncbi:TIGR02594 family protein [Nonlabens agnitus]|uniref:Peptidase C51 domain-containing protein n=1 Tax=Nonlabens agnitus TaxID=870484 RepID=A0A2S9WX98_9FLAO|nr:TIGR02594 family protein [Nonlabens agnitus]PRP68098.1 hypothetical protein BST86_13885 [Nonlabens agnitus]